MKTTTKAVGTLCALCLAQSSTRWTERAATLPNVTSPGEAAYGVAASQKVVSQKAADEKASRARLTRVARAALQAAHQTDDKFRFSNANYAAKIQAFLPANAPPAPSNARPRFNDNLANISVHAIEEPQNVVLFYEGQNRKLNFRHKGWAVVAFANGSVRSVTPAQAQKLRWHWNRVLDAQESDLKSGLDLSSPEKTARSFVNALNAGRFDLARRCIQGVDAAKATNAPLPGWEPQRFVLDISQFQPQQLAATISVAQYQVKVGTTPFVNGGKTAFLFDKGWRIAPAASARAASPVANGVSPQQAPPASGVAAVSSQPNPKPAAVVAASSASQSASQQVGTLSRLAAALINPQGVSLQDVLSSPSNGLQSETATRLKQLGLGVMQFVQDYEENLNFGPNDFQRKLQPYLKNTDVFRSPVTGRPFVMNPALSGMNLSQIAAPARTVLFYEGSNGRLFFSPDGTAAILFMDGHVGYVLPEQAATLIWTPPPVPVRVAPAASPNPNEAQSPMTAPNPQADAPNQNKTS